MEQIEENTLWKKEENEKKCLPSAYDLTLGKTGICRVSDLEHSANRFTAPHTRSSLWFKNEKKQNRLPSVRDLALDKPWLCQVRDRGHSANLHRTQPRPHVPAHTQPAAGPATTPRPRLPSAPRPRQPPAPCPHQLPASHAWPPRATTGPRPRMPRSSGCHRSSRSAAPLSARGVMRAAAPLSRMSKRPSRAGAGEPPHVQPPSPPHAPSLGALPRGRLPLCRSRWPPTRPRRPLRLDQVSTLRF